MVVRVTILAFSNSVPESVRFQNNPIVFLRSFTLYNDRGECRKGLIVKYLSFTALICNQDVGGSRPSAGSIHPCLKLEVAICDFKFEIANCDLKLGVCYVVAICDHVPVLGLAAKESLIKSFRSP